MFGFFADVLLVHVFFAEITYWIEFNKIFVVKGGAGRVGTLFSIFRTAAALYIVGEIYEIRINSLGKSKWPPFFNVDSEYVFSFFLSCLKL